MGTSGSSETWSVFALWKRWPRADFLAHNRRLSYLAIFILATIFNPVPEVFTQLLLASAAIALFELSIVLVRWQTKKNSP